MDTASAVEIKDWLQERSQRNSLCRHRQLICLSGDRDWAIQLVLRYLEQHASLGCLWLGDVAPESQYDFTEVLHREARQYLGSDQIHLVVDAWAGFDPDAVGALAGTLLPGGFLFLLVPPLNQWPSIVDPVTERFLSEGQALSSDSSGYLERLVRCLRTDESCALIQQGLEFDSCSIPQRIDSEPKQTCPAPFASEDQRRAVDAVCHVVKGHRRRPLVMTADRGRGKSAALGLAAGQLLNEGCQKILVTAPAPSAVSNLFEFAANVLPNAKREGYSVKSQEAELLFVAPDELLEALPKADLLLVDEAASIPIPMLLDMARQYSRVAFSSTVHGYEGTGRGFGLRFQQELNDLAPGWRALELKQPIRWATSDPLENSINRLLLLDADPADGIGDCQLSDVTLDWLLPSKLAMDEQLLSEVFGLLVQAHYQTSPSDLRQLLDSPGLHLCLARDGNQVVGVLMLVVEGGLNSELESAIFEGKRRPRGHLVLQSLIANAGLQGIGKLRGARVMRIATHPQCQMKGIGKALIHEAMRYACFQEMDFVASSFGATAGLLRFWERAGLLPVYLGSKRNAATGEYSAVVLQGITEAGLTTAKEAEQLFGRHLVPRLAGSLNTLSFDVLRQLTRHLKRQQKLMPQDLAIVEAYASGRRSFESSQAALQIWLSGEWQNLSLPIDGVNALVAKVMQGQSWRKVAELLDVSGRKAVESRLRQVALELLKAT